MSDALYTTEEVASQYRLKPSTIRKWIRNGVLPAVRIGRRYLISDADVLSLIQAAVTPKQASA